MRVLCATSASKVVILRVSVRIEDYRSISVISYQLSVIMQLSVISYQLHDYIYHITCMYQLHVMLAMLHEIKIISFMFHNLEYA